MAIDSSIWIYQFQATMRDNDGRALSNAHVLGFLRRIAKLLFYGIKPVFVFDGGAPALKRNTLNERRKKKSGAAISHARLAEKLLAAQLRREALNHTKGPQKPAKGKGKGKAPTGPVVLDDTTVYLEDIDSSMPRTPSKKANVDPSSVSRSKPRVHDHDPYRLPDVDLEAAVASATRAAVPDPRLATEEELRDFIEDMRPEDFDVTSPAFRELPTEVQYEIVGDLRLKSRQTSYARLQNMLRSASTPLDFSKQQIQNLRQRNTLTQQLLTTTDSIGKANLTIPVRVASERNREYLLIKNEGHEGGWILGIRDDGTRDKPIEIDKDSDKEDATVGDGDSDEDMEEVPIPQAGVPDHDLQQYQRTMNLAAIANRHPRDKHAAPPRRSPVPQPLFNLDDGTDAIPVLADDDDGELALAIQQSLDQANAAHRPRRPAMVNAVASSSKTKLSDTTPRRTSDSMSHYSLHDDDVFIRGNRLETALSIANAGSVRTPTKPLANPVNSLFGEPVLLQPAPPRVTPSPSSTPVVQPGLPTMSVEDTDHKAWGEPSNALFGTPVLLQATSPALPPVAPSPSPLSAIQSDHRLSEIGNAAEVQSEAGAPTFVEPLRPSPEKEPAPAHVSDQEFKTKVLPSPHAHYIEPTISDDDEEMEEVLPVVPKPATLDLSTAEQPANPRMEQPFANKERTPVPISSFPPPTATVAEGTDDPSKSFLYDRSPLSPESPPFSDSLTLVDSMSVEPPAPRSTPPVVDEEMEPPRSSVREDADDDEDISGWSRSPSPVVGLEQPQPRSSSPVVEDWDAAQEMDPAAEEGEFAQFMSHVKGKDLDEVRREIDDEIQVLNTQKKAAMRDSEDINQQMISQIMMLLSLFGIPYITAPMEAEAQCAELVHLGLANGVITDDSDVFLFGSQRVFKNMFNQSKTVECFMLSDLSRELGLDRDTLIRLAYLLGSDYVEGLPGIGPVVAMELLGEFPGKDGLHKFKDWWTRVQSGKDRPEDNKSKFRKRFKKNFKNLYLPPEWPNTIVRDAYYHPTVDESEEPFKWGLPDLDGLREFLYAELSWSPAKVDELLLPVIQRIRKRGQAGAVNRQADLDGFFDGAGAGSAVPRKRNAYSSKRLQQVVSEFRNKRKHDSKSPAADAQSQNSHSDDDNAPVKKKKKAAKAKGGTATKRGTAARGRGANKGTRAVPDDEADFREAGVDTNLDSRPAVRLRPRPKPAYKGVSTGAAGHSVG